LRINFQQLPDAQPRILRVTWRDRSKNATKLLNCASSGVAGTTRAIGFGNLEEMLRIFDRSFTFDTANMISI
jgi:hypothetical protein